MSKKLKFFSCLAAAALIFSACSGKSSGDLKSMEQIHEEEGLPVVTREMRPSTFTTFLKYPAAFMARSESTAKAELSDVVRTIRAKLGDQVKKDGVVITFSLDNPNYQQAKSSYANAEVTYRRTQRLFASNGVSRQNLDNAKTQYEVAKATLKAMDDAINVKAPIGGIITRLDVRVTENVQSGTVLFTVSNLDRVEARIWVSAKDIGFVKDGMPVMTEWLGETITGKVSQVNMIMDTEKKAFLVLAEFRNTGRLLTSGLNLDTTLETYRNDAALYIHRKELVTENGVPCVYVFVNDTAQRREVTIGKSQGLLLEITQGLNPGDLLISEGSQMVEDGARVYSVGALAGSTLVN
ncbi:MAG: efflux RND transporter periplasmic adaptor subunit [Spirochaetales bacterium]|jgi:RND family efflux transporter MFP subunit|nr:efflux RND transporter periplasmic adaptor subunit [Spirochaetales bacterium]